MTKPSLKSKVAENIGISPDADVRDFQTFALGLSKGASTQEINEASTFLGIGEDPSTERLNEAGLFPAGPNLTR